MNSKWLAGLGIFSAGSRWWERQVFHVGFGFVWWTFIRNGETPLSIVVWKTFLPLQLAVLKSYDFIRILIVPTAINRELIYIVWIPGLFLSVKTWKI